MTIGNRMEGKITYTITIFILAVLMPWDLVCQDLDYNFSHLGQRDGLSGAYYEHGYKDSRGYLWISSTDGLNRFDGDKVTVYRQKSDDPSSIKGNHITSKFFEDDSGNLWFTTYEAINCYIRKYDRFNSFQLKNNSDELIGADYYAFHLEGDNALRIRNVWVEDMHSLWAASDKSLVYFDLASKSFELFSEFNGSKIGYVWDVEA